MVLRTQQGFVEEEEVKVLSRVSTEMTRTTVPAIVGGNFALPKPIESEEEKARRFGPQRKHNLFDESVRSDSDEDVNPDIPLSLLPSFPSFSLFCKCRHNQWYDRVQNRPKHIYADAVST